MPDWRKLKDHLEKAVAAEDEDRDKYMELADMAPPEYAGILRDIAKEEAAHRRHLKDILCDMKRREDTE